MDRWTSEEWATGLRAEIERDGVPVNISDEELLEAAFSPLVAPLLELFKARLAHEDEFEKTADAMRALGAAFQRSEDFEDMFSDVRNLPETTPS
jgi:hypothetical protein